MSALEAGRSVIVLGDAGLDAGLPQQISNRWDGHFATAIYKGSSKKFFQQIAWQLEVPTESDDGKALSMDVLKEEIAMNCNSSTLLVFPEAKRLTTGVRYWLEDLIDKGVIVCCLAVVNPKRDVFLGMLEVELELPSDRAIRKIMQQEAQKLGIQLTESRLASLQPLVGRNPMLARKTIQQEALGINPEKLPEHAQYLDITPLIMAAVSMLGVLKFWGMASGDRTLYVIGGIAIMVGLAMRYAGKVGSNRKRYGQ